MSIFILPTSLKAPHIISTYTEIMKISFFEFCHANKAILFSSAKYSLVDELQRLRVRVQGFFYDEN